MIAVSARRGKIDTASSTARASGGQARRARQSGVPNCSRRQFPFDRQRLTDQEGIAGGELVDLLALSTAGRSQPRHRSG